MATRFWPKVEKTPTCWNWTASIRKDGYGRFRVNNNKMDQAHRVSLVLIKKKIPKGMWVDHICRNRSCVNPSHLRIVTPKQNSTENSNGWGCVNASKKFCKRGHILEGENLMKSRLPTRKCRICNNINQNLLKKRKKI